MGNAASSLVVSANAAVDNVGKAFGAKFPCPPLQVSFAPQTRLIMSGDCGSGKTTLTSTNHLNWNKTIQSAPYTSQPWIVEKINNPEKTVTIDSFDLGSHGVKGLDYTVYINLSIPEGRSYHGIVFTIAADKYKLKLEELKQQFYWFINHPPLAHLPVLIFFTRFDELRDTLPHIPSPQLIQEFVYLMQLQQHFGQHRPFYVQPSSCYETNSSTFTRHGVQEGFNWIAGMTRSRTTIAIPPITTIQPVVQQQQQQQQPIAYTTTFQASPSALHTMNIQQQQFNTTANPIAPSATATTTLQPSMSHISQQQQQQQTHISPYNQQPIPSPYGLPSPTVATTQPQPYNTGLVSPPSQQQATATTQNYNPYYNTTQPQQQQPPPPQAYQPYANLSPYPASVQQQQQQQIDNNNQKNLNSYDLPPSYNESEEFSAPTQDQIGGNGNTNAINYPYPAPYTASPPPPALQQHQRQNQQEPIISFQYANDDEEEEQQQQEEQEVVVSPPPPSQPQQEQEEPLIQLDTPTPPPTFDESQQSQQEKQQQPLHTNKEIDEDDQMAALLMNLPTVPTTTTTTTAPTIPTTQDNNQIEKELVTQ